MERIDPARSLKDRTVVRYVTLTFFGDADAGERSAIIYGETWVQKKRIEIDHN